MQRFAVWSAVLCLAVSFACQGAVQTPPGSVGDDDDVVGDDDDDNVPHDPLQLVVVTFNTGTSESMGHDSGPDDGYTSAHAAISDQYYGDGLAWLPAVEAATEFFATVQPDIVAFQEIFYSELCATIPPEAQTDFVCETWQPGDPTVANAILGPDYQVMCNPGKDDKCAAVKKSLGTFVGCDADFCLEGLDGYKVQDCGSGARVGRGTIQLTDGGTLTLVAYHGSSGFTADDKQCRVQQTDQVFVDLGDGAPGVRGGSNLVMGDLNTDPGRLTGLDPSAARWLDFVDLPDTSDHGFHFITDVGSNAEPSYSGLFNIDHVMSDAGTGSCWVAGLDNHPPVIDAKYFDHKPAVCDVEMPYPAD